MIDSNDRALTVEAGAVRGWSLSDRPTDPSEYMVIWDTYVDASDPIDAARVASREIEEKSNAILSEIIAVNLY